MAIEKNSREWNDLVSKIGQAIGWDFVDLNDLYLDCLTDINFHSERKQIEPFLRKMEIDDSDGQDGMEEGMQSFGKSSLRENFNRLNRAANSRLIETSIDDVLNLKIGSQIDWKFGLITRTVVRVAKDTWEINDLSGNWVSANVNREELMQLMSGELDLHDLDWK